MSVLARRRRRLVRPPRLPRAAEVDPPQRGRRLHEHARPALAGGAAGRRPRRLGHALGADLPARGVRAVPVRAACSRSRSSSSSSSCRELVERVRLPRREGARLRGRRLPRRRGAASGAGDVLVATSDRDAFQLASERTSRSSSPRAASASSRVSARPRCASATASSPSRCRTSSRCAATPPTSCRARAGSGPKKAADLLAQYGSLEAALAAGRFAAEAEDLRLFRRIATMDASAPLPPLAETDPGWAEASSFLDGSGSARSPAGSARYRGPDPPRARAAPSDRRAPGAAGAAAVLLAHQHIWSEAARRDGRGAAAAATPRSTSSSSAPVEDAVWLDGDTVCTATTFEAAALAAGTAIEAALRGGFALVRPPGHHALAGPRDGLLRVQQRRRRGPRGAAAPRPRPGRDRRLRRPPRQRHARRSSADDDTVLFVSLHQWPFYPGSGGPDDQAETTVNVPLPAGCGDEEYLAAFDGRSSSRP